MPGMGTKLAEILAMQPSMSQDQYDFAPHPERDALKAQRMRQMQMMQDMQDESMATQGQMPGATPPMQMDPNLLVQILSQAGMR